MQENEEVLLSLLSGNFIYLYLKKRIEIFYLFTLNFYVFFSEVEL